MRYGFLDFYSFLSFLFVSDKINKEKGGEKEEEVFHSPF